MTTSSLTEEDRTAIGWAKAIMEKQFPGIGPYGWAQVFAGEITPLPDYIIKNDSLKHAIVTRGASAYIGAATLCYGRHPETGELSLVLVRRRETGADGQHQYGILGGFTNPGYYEYDKGTITPHPGEQPWDGAIRENGEELLDDEGNRILSIDPSRLVIIDNGIDERSLYKGMLPVAYCGYAVALSDEEMARVVTHARRMKNDEAYHTSVVEKSGYEVADIEIMPLTQAAALSPSQFTHPHELHGIQTLCQALYYSPTHDPRAAMVHRSFAAAQSVVIQP